MPKIIVNFEKLIQEMKDKKFKLCLFSGKNNGWFVIDKDENFYQIETYYHNGYLEDYIINKNIIEFTLLSSKATIALKALKREIYNISKVEKFIETVVNISSGIS